MSQSSHSHETHSHQGQTERREETASRPKKRVLTIRSHSGLSGDMTLCGLAAIATLELGINPASESAAEWLHERAEKIMPELADSVRIVKKSVNNIAGLSAKVTLPHAHEHRDLNSVRAIIVKSAMREQAKEYAATCFELLARCEAEIHDAPIEAVHFHEVGALDSILDICCSCELYCELGEPTLICSPLPLADGEINCAHGFIPAPAPATLKLLRGVPVRPFAGDVCAGELVTPTAIALLLALKADFGPWPALIPLESVIAYGGKIFQGAANGAVFALGLSD